MASNIEKVRVYGYIKTVEDNPVPAAEVRVRLSPVPQYNQDTLIVTDDVVFITDETGYFEFSLIGGTYISVIVPSVNLQLSGRLPFKGSIELTQLDKQP